MEPTFALPAPLAIAAAVIGTFFASILPTCLYLYVEPRGRIRWAVAGEAVSKRRAPGLVRITAWLSFALGQIAIPWLLVPAACAVLLYLQAKLGLARPLGVAATVGVGAAALVQALLAMRAFPLGVRLLVRDAKLCETAAVGARARAIATVNISLFAGAALASWAMQAVPGLVHPWLRAALAWTALRPVMALAAVSLLHASLLARCAAALREPPKGR